MLRSPATSRRRRRTQQPQNRRAYQRPLATEYSRDPELSDPVYLVRTLRAQPQACDDLLADTTPAYAAVAGAARAPTRCCTFAFLCSDVIDVKTWCDRWATSAVWPAAGFATVPNFRTVWLRFTELERYAAAFEHAAQKLIAQARRHDENIGRHLHVDGNHFTTPRPAGPLLPGPTRLRRALEAAWRHATGEGAEQGQQRPRQGRAPPRIRRA